MQDHLHCEQLGELVQLLKPLAKMIGPWPFVVLMAIVFAFLAVESSEFFGFLDHVLLLLSTLIKAAIAAFFAAGWPPCRKTQALGARGLEIQARDCANPL